MACSVALRATSGAKRDARAHDRLQHNVLISQGTSAAVNPKLVADKAQLEISENPQGRSGAPGVKGERERVDGSELLTQGSSWEEWLKHFDAMDELAEDAAHYQVSVALLGGAGGGGGRRGWGEAGAAWCGWWGLPPDPRAQAFWRLASGLSTAEAASSAMASVHERHPVRTRTYTDHRNRPRRSN